MPLLSNHLRKKSERQTSSDYNKSNETKNLNLSKQSKAITVNRKESYHELAPTAQKEEAKKH